METCLIENTMLLGAGWLDPSYWWGVAQVVIGLGLVIFVHELGHFLVAKACGVKCEKFYVGFDFFDLRIGDRVIVPKSLVKFQWGETEYGVGIIPLGGYVKMLGQDDNPANLEKEVERSKANEDETGDELYEPSGLVDRTKMDPRSFLAKTVPQRMAIISAGVIFNILFAIILAAIAFRSGVRYEPAMIGGVAPGGPAWEINLPESRVIRIGDQKVDDSYFTFTNMAEAIIFAGSEEDAEVEIEYIPTGESKSKTVKIATRQIGTKVKIPRIGVSPIQITQLPDFNKIPEGRSAAECDPPFMGGDDILEVNGIKAETMGQVKVALASNYGNPTKVLVERSSKGLEEGEIPEQVEITIPADPMRTLGIEVEWGPVGAIQKGSPADKAGFEVGDKIISINGQPVRNLYALDIDAILHMREKGDEPMEFVVDREGKELTLTASPRMPIWISQIDNFDATMPIGFDSLGMTIGATDTIAYVDESSPAAKAGIQVGDQVIGSKIILTDSQKKDPLFAKAGRERPYNTWWSGKKIRNWTFTEQDLQRFPVGQEVELTIKRGDDSEEKFEMQTVASNDYFLPTMGVPLRVRQEVYTAESWGEAFQLGTKQTWSDLTKVFKFLGKLVRGRIGVENLGGPGTIFVVATSEASQGTSRLLLFLVLLSANLAIINFLPIPVLDGGHMMFLAYEGLFRKPVTEQVQVVLTYAGLFALLALMAFVLYQDAWRISGLF